MEHDKNHELEQNDLWYFLTHFDEYWGRYGNWVTGFVVLVAVVLLGYQFMTTSRVASREEAWSRLDLADNPEAYAGVAIDYRSNATIAALANLRGADQLLNEAVMGRGGGSFLDNPTAEPPVALTAEEREQHLADAARRYQSVIDGRGVHPVIQLNARLGLAAVAEAQGEFEQAGGYYDQVIESPDATDPMIALAEDRKAALPRLKSPVTFAEAPVAPMRSEPTDGSGIPPMGEFDLMPRPSGGADTGGSSPSLDMSIPVVPDSAVPAEDAMPDADASLDAVDPAGEGAAAPADDTADAPASPEAASPDAVVPDAEPEAAAGNAAEEASDEAMPADAEPATE